MDFGRVLEWFWEAKIFNFRIFWDIFSIQIDIKLKLAKKCEKNAKLVPPAGGREAPRRPTPCAVTPGWRFGHILLKNKHPVQAGSKF